MVNIKHKVAGSRLKVSASNADIGFVTASFGISRFTEGCDAEALIKRADELLYAAKKAGRNKVLAEGLD